jgi:hypothetical protein
LIEPSLASASATSMTVWPVMPMTNSTPFDFNVSTTAFAPLINAISDLLGGTDGGPFRDE